LFQKSARDPKAGYDSMNTYVLEKSTNESTGKPEQKFDAAFKKLFNWTLSLFRFIF
jgi:hypothetical protein